MGKIVSSFWERHIHNLVSERDQTWKGGSRIKLDMCLQTMESDVIGGNQVQIWKVLHFDPPQPLDMWCQWIMSNPSMN